MKIEFYKGDSGSIKMLIVDADGKTLSFALDSAGSQRTIWTVPLHNLSGFENKIDVDGWTVLQALANVLDKLPET